jgi:hypothetical protein
MKAWALQGVAIMLWSPPAFLRASLSFYALKTIAWFASLWELRGPRNGALLATRCLGALELLGGSTEVFGEGYGQHGCAGVW